MNSVGLASTDTGQVIVIAFVYKPVYILAFPLWCSCKLYWK